MPRKGSKATERSGGPGERAVEKYLADVPDEFRSSIEALRSTIRAAAPDAEEVIGYRMPAFRSNGMLVYYAAFRDHCSLFVASSRVRARFAEELRPFESGKGTLRFTPDRPIPKNLIRRIVRARLAENAAKASARARRPRKP
jgi:uncharacterized protein YdhG (YjbR/CyaY superfamily)